MGPDGIAYVTGSTQATDFPTTDGAFDRAYGGGVDAFVAALNPTGSGLVYSTYLGGPDTDQAMAIAVDGAGRAVVTGLTNSAAFPTANALQPVLGGSYDVFVTRLNATGTGLVASTFLGGTGLDSGDAIALDAAGNVYVAGTASSADFPTTPGAFQPGRTAPGDDAFVAKLDLAVTPTLVVGGFPSPTTAGVARSFTVTVRDATGNVMTGYTGTVHFTSTDPQAGLPADYTFTAADQGVRTFTATLKTAGTQAISVRDVATASLVGTQAGITITPAAAARLEISGPVSVATGAVFSVTVTVRDAYGNVATGYTGTVKFTSTDSRAVLPNNYKFTSSDRGVRTFTGVKLRTKGTQKITVVDTLNSTLTAVLALTVT